MKDHKKPGFVRRRGFMLGTPKSCFQVLVQLTETILREKHLPQYLALIVKDFVRYGRVDLVTERCMNVQQQRKPKSLIGVLFQYKGIYM